MMPEAKQHVPGCLGDRGIVHQRVCRCSSRRPMSLSDARALRLVEVKVCLFTRHPYGVETGMVPGSSDWGYEAWCSALPRRLVDARSLRPVLIPKLRPGRGQPLFEHNAVMGDAYGRLATSAISGWYRERRDG
jgi:hypothetical protein